MLSSVKLVNMASLLESYEHQYSSLTADITVKIGKISKTHGLEKQNVTVQVERLFDEAVELLEQMDLEVKEQAPKDRQKYQTRLKSYKAELDILQKDLKRARLGLDSRDELLGLEDVQDSSDQRSRLLDNTETLERSSRRLDHGYRTVVETEEIGAQIMEDLHSQRQTIQRSRQRVEEMNSNLGKSSRVLSGMMRRIIQNRVLLVGMAAMILVVIALGIYFTVKKSQS